MWYNIIRGVQKTIWRPIKENLTWHAWQTPEQNIILYSDVLAIVFQKDEKCKTVMVHLSKDRQLTEGARIHRIVLEDRVDG